MTDEEPEGQVVGQVVSGDATEPMLGSIESWLQERRAELSEEKAVEIPIPGFADRLVGVYHKPSYKPLRQIGKRNAKLKLKEDLRELYGACDTLILCCEDIYALDGEQRVSLGKWSLPLLARFGVKGPGITTTRIGMLQLYKRNELMIVEHSAKLFEMTHGDDEDEDEDDDSDGIAAEEAELLENSEPASAGTSD